MSQAPPSLSVYYHTHWDREWYQPFREYQVRLAEVVDRILDYLETGVLPCFMLDGQTVILEDYLDLRPANRPRLEAVIRSGKLTVGPWYVMPDEFLVSGESLIRNLQHGMTIANDWGSHRFSGYLPDTFGHSDDIPLLFRQFGIGSAVLWRGVNPTHSEFTWKSRSGETVLGYHLAEGYMQNLLHDPDLSREERTQALTGLIAQIRRHAANRTALLPIGGDHLGPVPPEGRAVLLESCPEIQETTPERFFEDLSALNHQDLPVITGELRDNTGAFLLPGVYSARLYLKQANRRLEHRLTREVEPLLAMAQTLLPQAPPYPVRELEIAWRTLLLNHPHDSICGCSVDAVHRENEVRFDTVGQLCDALSRRAVQAFRQLAGPNQWIIFNHSDTPYSGIVPAVEYADAASEPSALTQIDTQTTVLTDNYLYDISDLPMSHKTRLERRGWIQATDVPPHGYRIIPRQPITADITQPVATDASTLENDRYLVTVQPDGTLTIVEKSTGRSFDGLLQFSDRPDQGDSYNSAPVPGSQPEPAILTGARVLVKGPLVSRLELHHRLPNSGIELTTVVTLTQGSQPVVFETTFTNTRTNHKLQVGFPTGAPVAEVWAESHFGLTRRSYDPDYSEQTAMPAARMKELAANTGPVQRFFGTNGHAFITEGLTEYEVSRDTVAITLLRAFGALSSGETGVRGAQAGPPFATPEGQCLSRTLCYRCAWFPFAEAALATDLHTLYREADLFYGAVQAEQGRGQSSQHGNSSLLNWNNPQIVTTALHWTEKPQPGLIARLINTTKEPQKLKISTGLDYQVLHETDFRLTPRKTLPGDTITFEPYEVKTLFFEKRNA